MNAQPEIAQLALQHSRLWIVAAPVGVGFAIWSGRILFGDWGGFLEALRYWFQPQWLSLFRGEFWEDTKSEFKLFFWLAGGLVVTGIAKLGLTKLVIMFSLVERFHLPI